MHLTRSGLLCVGVTFVFVAFALLLQVVSATLFKVPGAYYALAACDPPAVIGAWLSAIGRDGPVEPRDRGLLVGAAIALTIVACVVVGDLGLSRVASGSALAKAVGSKAAWLVADAGTVVALGTLAAASRGIAAQKKPLPVAWVWGVGILLLVRVATAAVGALGDVPWPLRVVEAALFGAVAFGLLHAARTLTPRKAT